MPIQLAGGLVGIRISELPVASDLTGIEKMVIVQGGQYKQVSESLFSTIVGPQGPAGPSILPISDTTGNVYTKTSLNTSYPDAIAGQYIYQADLQIKYLKLDNSPTGNWDTQPYNPVV